MGQETNSFFDEIKDWSERKLNLLRKYLESATKILGSIDQVYYVDGFAGRGSYGVPNQEQIPGSPLRAAQLAQQYKREGKTYTLRCINIESDKCTFDGLQKATESYKDVVTNLHGPFANNIDTVLKIVGDKPVICFLDPFGIDGMDMDAIQKLIRRRGITDFWIRFEAGAVRRRDGYFENQNPSAEKQFEILCRVYGIFDRVKLHNLLAGSTSEERKAATVELYLQQLSNEFSNVRGSGYAAAYQIGSLEGDNKYHLVFATAGEKGLSLASNIVYGIEESYQKEVEWYRLKRTGQLSMFSTIDPTEEEIFDAKVNTIQDQILREYKGQSITRLAIHTQLITNGWFGVIKGPHLTQALKNLCKSYGVQANGRISNDDTIFKFREN